MNRFAPLLLLLILVPGAQAAPGPRDIAAYVERRKACNHWAGEEGYDKARMAEINRAVAQQNCLALDADEKKLLRRYRHAPARLKQIRAAKDALL
jgi:hypothetical protein